MKGHKMKDPIPLDQLLYEDLDEETRNKFLMVLSDPNFLKSKTFREQIGITCQILRYSAEKPMSYEKIAHVFGSSGASIQEQDKKFQRIIRPPGRPRVLPAEALTWVKLVINEKLSNNEPYTYKYLMDSIESIFHISIKQDTLRHICRSIEREENARLEHLE